MSDEVRPALTPPEWAKRRKERTRITGYPGTVTYNEERAYVDGSDSNLYAYRQGAATVIPSDLNHALAALALHGQPFGFSWADVDRLRDCPEVSDWHTLEEMDAWYAFAEGLATRIAALLPPREENRG